MHISVPSDWRRAGKLQFQHILHGLNWKKDDFGFYIIVGTHPPQRFATDNGKGEIWVDPLYLPDDD